MTLMHISLTSLTTLTRLCAGLACALAIAPAWAVAPLADNNFDLGLGTGWTTTGDLRGRSPDRYVRLQEGERLVYTFHNVAAGDLNVSFWYLQSGSGESGDDHHEGQGTGAPRFDLTLMQGSFQGLSGGSSGGGSGNRRDNPGPGNGSLFETAPAFHLQAQQDYTLILRNRHGDHVPTLSVDNFAFALSVPEPQEWALLLAGLGLLMLVRRRHHPWRVHPNRG